MTKKKQFYSHLVKSDTLIFHLNNLNLKEDEKIHLTAVFESSLHYTIIEIVLTNLKEDDKKAFIEYLNSDNREETLAFLKERIKDIEDKIAKTALDLTRDFLADIGELKLKVKRN